MAQKRKSTNPLPTRTIATKAPRYQPLQVSIPHLLRTHPWLTRPQSISPQDLFVLHTRDNLVAGATGPKDWDLVTAEFNEAFKDELKKPLAWNTLSKRCGVARKIFLRENGEYAGVVRYPVPEFEDGEEEEEDSDGGGEMIDGEEMDEDEGSHVSGLLTGGGMMYPTNSSFPAQNNAAPLTPQHSSSPPRNHRLLPATSPAPLSPDFYNPSCIPDHYINPLTRAKFHLRQRTVDPVTFHFLDAHEGNLLRDDPQYIDAKHLASISPFFARKAKQTSRDSVINVPANFSVRTVNIFVQLVAPWPATNLPDHYLWKARKPVPGVYDRFGGINLEKITWTVDTLLDLLFFAQMLEVYWIIDMVIDRLQSMYVKQKKYVDICKAMGEPDKGWVKIGGRSVFVGARLPAAENHSAGVSAEEFGKEMLVQLVAGSVDRPTLTFVADLLSALGGELGVEWLGSAVQEVKIIFLNANAASLDTNMREEFCARYHHHSSALQSCYTSHTDYVVTDTINALYATATPQELINLSKGLLLPSSLSSILYAETGDSGKLNKDNSSSAMLEAEEMTIEMETRLEGAKAALHRAREAPEAEKWAAIDRANEAAGAMYGPSQL